MTLPETVVSTAIQPPFQRIAKPTHKVVLQVIRVEIQPIINQSDFHACPSDTLRPQTRNIQLHIRHLRVDQMPLLIQHRIRDAQIGLRV